MQLNGLFRTIDIRKVFNFVSHSFLFSTLERFRFGNRFIKWLKVLLRKQEPCIINGGNTAKYFKFEKDKRQGDPVPAYLFILFIIFVSVKENKNLKGINITISPYIYIRNIIWWHKNIPKRWRILIEIMKVFDIFSSLSCLKPSKSKCEIAGIGAPKWVKLTLCGNVLTWDQTLLKF